MPRSEKKKPKSNYQANPKKVPQQEGRIPLFSEFPIWSFQYIDKEHPKWGVSCNGEHLIELMEKMHSLESRKWSEIIDDKKQNHYIGIEKCCGEAQSRIYTLKLEDKMDHLFSLRLNGTFRLFGILDSRIFKVVWIDPNHKVCISNLKHT